MIYQSDTFENTETLFINAVFEMKNTRKKDTIHYYDIDFISLIVYINKQLGRTKFEVQDSLASLGAGFGSGNQAETG